MYLLIILLIILASVLMIGIVLIQESKGGGLASSFSTSNQIMGVRKTTDFLEKATWGLSIAMVVLSIISIRFVPKADTQAAIQVQQTVPAQQKNTVAPDAATETPAPTPAEPQQ